ncbi:MAG: type II secretion system GspH family protein, partial [Patescibacteria group bacterium]|nr:type II secretion system GspH family protein [Patescibacteria group bacterium]
MTDSVPSSCSSFTHKIASLLSAFPNLALRNRGSSAPAADTRYTLGKKLLFHKRPSFFASESFLKARLGNPFSLVSSLSSLFTYLFHFFPSLLKKTAYFVRSSRNPDLLGSDEIGKSGREAEGNFPQEKIQPRLPKEKLSYRSSFTLIELLIVIAILVILAVVVILTLNPSELLAQSRDSARLSDMASLNSAINIYLVDSAGTGFLGTSSVVYV